MVPDQYYPKDIFSFGKTETLVECGSNNGDTLQQFFAVTGNEYQACYLFEPDRDCVKILKHRIKSEWIGDNIHVIERGAWDCETELAFYTDPDWGASHIVEAETETRILTGTIDDSIDEPVTFIKMDIEGAEPKALKGAEKTIKRYKPKLAICVYHDTEDFLSIPEYLHALVPEYKFYLRHHNWGATETVLYVQE